MELKALSNKISLYYFLWNFIDQIRRMISFETSYEIWNFTKLLYELSRNNEFFWNFISNFITKIGNSLSHQPHRTYKHYLHDRPYISPWMKSISNELDVYGLTRVLFWCLFPSLLRSSPLEYIHYYIFTCHLIYVHIYTYTIYIYIYDATVVGIIPKLRNSWHKRINSSPLEYLNSVSVQFE